MLPIVLAAAALLLAGYAVHQSATAEPVLHDEGLALETYASGFCCRPTGMEFVGDDDLLVLEKNGHVRLVRDGQLLADPVLIVETTPVREMGLLGIAKSGEYVYLYYTVPDAGGDPVSNRIERYSWDGQSLTDPVTLVELPANTYHNGGAMATGPGGQVYAVIGDTGRYGPLQNKGLEGIHPPGTTDYLDTSVILRVDPPGPYYAVGVRNSFGIAFDPATGTMWDTENGDDDSDEINVVPDGFNSGWEAVMGPATDEGLARMVGYEGYEYRDPEFTWHRPVAPTGIGFADFGSEYDGSVFVGDCNHGRLYMFKMNQDRDGLAFASPGLQDGVADEGDPLEEIIVAEGLGCITNIRTGPDGYLYVASYSHDAIYRILPASAGQAPRSDVRQPEEGGGCLIATAAYGTELAPQVQMLREIRDGKLLPTESGAAFMSAFNEMYYSFSPAVADMERESPALRAAVRATMTPMLHSLSLMSLADGSELQTTLLGTAVIMLNVAMYAGAPAAAAFGVRRGIVRWSGPPRGGAVRGRAHSE
jgi:glucose/arabinose dehydrogenase